MINKFDITLYNDDFFLWHILHAREYSIKNMDWYIDTYNPKSIVDFGCGIASYLESGFNKGVKILKGFDIGGEYAKKYTPIIVEEYVEYLDCTKEINCGKYDCVISFETAEHIDPNGTDSFLKNIINALSKDGRILFTAAPPGQEGTGHINCETKEFWLQKFYNLGHTLDQKMLSEIKHNWNIIGCPSYINENLLVLKWK